MYSVFIQYMYVTVVDQYNFITDMYVNMCTKWSSTFTTYMYVCVHVCKVDQYIRIQ